MEVFPTAKREKVEEGSLEGRPPRSTVPTVEAPVQ